MIGTMYLCILSFDLYNIEKSQSGEDSASEGVIWVAFLTGKYVAHITRIQPPSMSVTISKYGKIKSAPCSSQNVLCNAMWNARATTDPFTKPSIEIQVISVTKVRITVDFLKPKARNIPICWDLSETDL